jgi:hypothetical protein
MSQDAAVAQIAQLRTKLAESVEFAWDRFIDAAEAEGTTQAWQRVVSEMAKQLPGLAVQEKKDPYANLPTINFTIGPNMQLTATVEAAPSEAVEVVDVEAKEATNVAEIAALPEDTLALLDFGSLAMADD